MKENKKVNYAAWNVIYADKCIETEASFFGVTVSDVENKIANWMEEDDKKAGMLKEWDGLTESQRRIKIEETLGRSLF
jgi:hypothetical protein